MKKHKDYTAGSRFWLGRDFDTDFKRGKGVDYTKLAAAQRAIGNFVNIVTGKQIPVLFQSSERSYTDGESVVIGTRLEDKNFDSAVGLALHEGSHIALTDFTMFRHGSGHSTDYISNTKMANIVRLNGYDPEMDMKDADFLRIKDLLNWIEDRRIDYAIYTAAPGYRLYYEAMYDKYFNDKIIDKALKQNVKTTECWDDYMFHVINFTNPNRNLKALAQLQLIWDMIDLKNIQRLNTTEEALLLAAQIWQIIDKACVQEKQDNLNVVQKAFQKAGLIDDDSNATASMPMGGGSAPETADEEEEEEDETEDGEGDAEDDGDNEMDAEIDIDGDVPTELASDETDPGLTEKEMEQLLKAIAAQREFVKGNIKKQGRLTKGQARLVKAIRDSGTETRQVYTDASGTMDPIETVVVKNLTPAIIGSIPSLFASSAIDYINGTRSMSEYAGAEIRAMEGAVQRGLVLGRQLGNRLQLRNADKTLKSTRLQTGKIDRRLISQLGYGNADVFHRIVTDRFKNYFIHISIDASGSMQGVKFQNAITSAVAIAQAASMTTGIRVQISFRGTDRVGGDVERCVTVYAYDSAKDKMNKIKSYFKYLDCFGCTPEGLAFKSIESDLMRDAKGDECIFINYSDGEPTDVAGVSRGYRGVDFTRRVIANMRSNNINIISYFIHQGTVYDSTRDNFCKMYGQDASFIDPHNMNDVAKTMNRKFLEIA